MNMTINNDFFLEKENVIHHYDRHGESLDNVKLKNQLLQDYKLDFAYTPSQKQNLD